MATTPRDAGDLFADDFAITSTLHVNASFAARFDRENSRKEEQRLATATAASPLSEAAILVLLRCVRKTVTMVKAKLLRSKKRGADAAEADAEVSALERLTPPVIAAAAVRKANFRVSAEAGALLDMRDISDPVSLAALTRVICHSTVKKQLAGLAKYLLRTGLSNVTVSTARKIDLVPTSAMESAPAVACPPPPLRAPPSEASPAKLRDEHCRDVPAEHIISFHSHGRGAGRDRGLNPSGEPFFEDLHPSWQAKRRIARREAKIVCKKLRAQKLEPDAVFREHRLSCDDDGDS